MKQKMIISIFIIILMLVSSGMSINALKTGNKQVIYISNNIPQNLNNGITNITAQNAYDKLTNTGDGIQIPIDVREIDEWKPQRIDTPIPEHPRWYLWDLIKNASILPKFLAQYDGCEIIVYCKDGYKSWLASNSILDADFNGEIYNMVGGITAWITAGLPTAKGEFYEITVHETMLLCSSTGNGIQTLVDVRNNSEWKKGFFDTPWPESPIWHIIHKLKDDYQRSLFMEKYIGNEVILYSCCGHQSYVGCCELYYNNFTGTIYDVHGGIDAWKEAGLPIRNNTAPDIPVINGPKEIGTGYEINFTFKATDPENDGVKYNINWGDGPDNDTTLMYAAGEEVTVSHSWTDRGKYTITVKAVDFYDNESGLGSFELRVPKAFNYNFNLLEWLFERFPKAFPILRYILRF